MATTTTIALEEPRSAQLTHLQEKRDEKWLSSSLAPQDANGDRHDDIESVNSPPNLEFSTLQKWNEPRGNIFRFIACFYCFFVVGLSDAAYGALLPYLERYYNLTYTVVSLIFLCPFVGYTIAAFANSWFHHRFGQRGIAIIAPACYVVSSIVLSLHPPWPVAVLITVLSGFGTGLIDAAWSTWAGHMEAGNVLEGSLHAFYALGCTFSPLIATSLVVTRGLEWYCFYYMLTGLSVLALFISGATFWSKTGEVYTREHPREEGVSSTRTALRNKVTWLCCAFFLTYTGAEVALGGWIVSFMLHVRRASPYTSGMVATGFWAGMTLGRSLLGVLTHFLISYTNKPPSPTSSKPANFLRRLRLSERSIVAVYLFAAIAIQLLFWLIPSITASAVAVVFLGLFLGPLFPSAIIMATKLLPNHLHVPSVGFSTALGGTGAAVFPFIVGAVAQEKGVQVLQPIILGMLVVLGAVWCCFPRMKKSGEHDD